MAGAPPGRLVRLGPGHAAQPPHPRATHASGAAHGHALESQGPVEPLRGPVALPDFQRDYDWTDKEVRQLLTTALMGWPAGSLLLIDWTRGFLPVRSFSSSPELSAEPETIVLDGQQRLTTLYNALYDVGDRVYGVDIDGWSGLDVDDLDDRVKSIERSKWESSLKEPHQQHAASLVPLHCMRTPEEFFAWRDAVVDLAPSAEARDLRDHLTNLYREAFSNVSAYHFPVVQLPCSLDVTAISRVFERVNRTGVKLSTFDLVVARTYAAGWNLRVAWLEALESSHELTSFFGTDGDGLPLLR